MNTSQSELMIDKLSVGGFGSRYIVDGGVDWGFNEKC